MIVKLNLLDESEIPKETSSEMVSVEAVVTHAGGKNWLIMGPAILAGIFLCYAFYYFFFVKMPLNKIRNEITVNENILSELKPQVAEAEEAAKKLDIIKNHVKEFEIFIHSKKSWSKILNVLSDEVPDEIIFTRITLSSGTYRKKNKTDAGLLTTKLESDILKIDMEVPEAAQNVIPVYLKKLKNHPWLKTVLFAIESGGLALREKNYATSFQLYFAKNLEDINPNDILE
ncbi:MAG: hypothetical protein JW774_00250 [Candidatus Aureabacteria bacterium]|nr:hypothetical protein [Candidatus Auribacterota bacterium]